MSVFGIEAALRDGGRVANGPIDLSALRARLGADRLTFSRSLAPHIVLDGFLSEPWLAATKLEETVRLVGKSGAVDRFRYYNTRSTATTGMARLPPAVVELINTFHSAEFLAYLSQLTGIPNLVPDPMLTNGGIHFMEPGGYLRLHRDELIHPVIDTLRRRLNFVVYLHPTWEEGYGGHLEVWTRDGRICVNKIAPNRNRCIMTLIDANLHGVPDPVACPEGQMRTALVLWFYTEEAHPVAFQPAFFVARSGDGWRHRVLVELESRAFGLYHRLRRRHRTVNGAALRAMRWTRYGRVVGNLDLKA
jgi:hypothetical protein